MTNTEPAAPDARPEPTCAGCGEPFGATIQTYEPVSDADVWWCGQPNTPGAHQFVDGAPDTRPRCAREGCGRPLQGDYIGDAGNWHHQPPHEPECARCLDHKFQPAPDTHSATSRPLDGEVWFPDSYCSKHDGYHLQNADGGTEITFRYYADAMRACEALNHQAAALQEARERAERFAETERRREEKTPTIEAARDEVWEYAGRYIPDGTAIHGLKTPLAKLNAAYWLEVERAEAEVVALRDDKERLRGALVEVLTHHVSTPTMGCSCGWNKLGHSFPEHVANEWAAALAPAASRPVPGAVTCEVEIISPLGGNLVSARTCGEPLPCPHHTPAPTPVSVAENAEACGCVGHGHGGYHPGTCECCDAPVVPNEEVRE